MFSANIFSPSVNCLHVVGCALCCIKVWSFSKVTFSCCDLCFWPMFKKPLANPRALRLLPHFALRVGLFHPLHLGIWSIRVNPGNFVHLFIDFQQPQHHLVKGSSLLKWTVTRDPFLVMISDVCFLSCWLVLSLVSPKSLKYLPGVTDKQPSIHSALVQMVIGAQLIDFTLAAIQYHQLVQLVIPESSRSSSVPTLHHLHPQLLPSVKACFNSASDDWSRNWWARPGACHCGTDREMTDNTEVKQQASTLSGATSKGPAKVWFPQQHLHLHAALDAGHVYIALLKIYFRGFHSRGPPSLTPILTSGRSPL